MRRYRMRAERADEFMRRVDESFADQLAAQAGFVSYVLIDCGEGDVFTLSMFAEAAQAEASRALAQRWTEEQLKDIEFTRYEAIHGASAVSRAAPGMLEPSRFGGARKAVSIRLYRVRSGTVPELLQAVDRAFADRLQSLEGFEASHLLDCDDGELLWISVLRDEQAVDASEEQALAFMRSELAEFRLEREVAIRGEIAVSRANSVLLEPAHA
ncbi:hypothetical protein DVA67_008045 [Solirubrobacter sp. CPCC 204708]|uniref:ABM domain-containing protein n=1 Tax=Solirubrobacter deserti TaxID=2282478 RepID=A0ABT4RSZ4_9ACTN|nr:hypothetical protein [Solirubrobacter deserti]MBE2315922.1 hypothetical protein [Solirubrobacter deserti]MDA0141602.1 hypothetical protein [Solirubrobacter deserti]